MESVINQVTALETMNLKELRLKYLELFNEKAPNCSSREALIPKLAYQLQVIVYGGLSERAVKVLENINEGKLPSFIATCNKYSLTPGSTIEKFYNGILYKIKVTPNDFIFNGIHYKSLSPIAMAIAPGSNRSGPMFFGLTEKKK